LRIRGKKIMSPSKKREKVSVPGCSSCKEMPIQKTIRKGRMADFELTGKASDSRWGEKLSSFDREYGGNRGAGRYKTSGSGERGENRDKLSETREGMKSHTHDFGCCIRKSIYWQSRKRERCKAPGKANLNYRITNSWIKKNLLQEFSRRSRARGEGYRLG